MVDMSHFTRKWMATWTSGYSTWSVGYPVDSPQIPAVKGSQCGRQMASRSCLTRSGPGPVTSIKSRRRTELLRRPCCSGRLVSSKPVIGPPTGGSSSIAIAKAPIQIYGLILSLAITSRSLWQKQNSTNRVAIFARWPLDRLPVGRVRWIRGVCPGVSWPGRARTDFDEWRRAGPLACRREGVVLRRAGWTTHGRADGPRLSASTSHSGHTRAAVCHSHRAAAAHGATDVVSADGQRFLIIAAPEDRIQAPINVILNWHPENDAHTRSLPRLL